MAISINNYPIGLAVLEYQTLFPSEAILQRILLVSYFPGNN